MISNSYNPNNKQKQQLQTKHYVYIAFSLIFVIALIVLGIRFWPEDKAPIELNNTEVEENPNKIAGEAYLDSISRQPGVLSLGGGVFYKIIKPGSGAKPSDNSTVKVNYEGRLIDGKVFDSSYKRKQAAEFPVNGVIYGWQLALKAMPVGSTWEIYIPEYYGYGANGSGENIPPYSALVFKVELLGIK